MCRPFRFSQATKPLPQFQADPRFKVVIGTTEGETVLGMNNKKPPFDNPKVRQAIAHAIDRKALIDGAMFGLGTPIGSFFPPHHPAYLDLTSETAYDPELVKEASGRGWPCRWLQDNAETARHPSTPGAAAKSLRPNCAKSASKLKSYRWSGRNGLIRFSRTKIMT